MCFIQLGTFQLPFGDEAEARLATSEFSQDSDLACKDLVQSFVNLELGRVKIETTQQVTLHLCMVVTLLVTCFRYFS